MTGITIVGKKGLNRFFKNADLGITGLPAPDDADRQIEHQPNKSEDDDNQSAELHYYEDPTKRPFQGKKASEIIR